jgi:hypothetical protein
MSQVRKIFLLAQIICLFMSTLLSEKASAFEPTYYYLYIENHTEQNLIIFVDDELSSVVCSHEESSGIQLFKDFVVEVKTGHGEVVYHADIKCEGIKRKDMTITIPASAETPSVDMTDMQGYPVRIHNPSDYRVVILINGIPIDVIQPHFGIYSTCWFRVGDEGSNNQQLIEAKDSQGILISSRIYTLSELSNNGWIITALPSDPVTFSLDIENLTSQALNIMINDQLIGSMLPDTIIPFDGLTIEPRLEWKALIEVGWEMYLIEATDLGGHLLYSKEFNWIDFEPRKWTIVVPFSPKLRVYNDTNEMLTIFVKGKPVGEVAPSQKEYFFGLDVTRDFSFIVKAKNQEGDTVYSEKLYVPVLQDLDWDLVIITQTITQTAPKPINWILIWSILGGVVALILILWLTLFRRMMK